MPDVPNVPGVPTLTSYAPNNDLLLTSDALAVVAAFLPPPWGIYYQGTPVLLPASVASSVITTALAPITAAASLVTSLIGIPNLLPVFASTIEFDFNQEWTIADYPQEQGAFQSYDKVQLPFELRVRMASGGTAASRQAFLNTVFAIAGGSPLGSNSLITTVLGGVGGLTSMASSLTGGILSGAIAPPLFDIATPEGTYSSCSVRRLSFSRKSSEGATLIVVDMDFIQVRQTSTLSFSSTAVPGAAGQQSSGNVGTINSVPGNTQGPF